MCAVYATHIKCLWISIINQRLYYFGWYQQQISPSCSHKNSIYLAKSDVVRHTSRILKLFWLVFIVKTIWWSVVDTLRNGKSGYALQENPNRFGNVMFAIRYIVRTKISTRAMLCDKTCFKYALYSIALLYDRGLKLSGRMESNGIFMHNRCFKCKPHVK